MDLWEPEILRDPENVAALQRYEESRVGFWDSTPRRLLWTTTRDITFLVGVPTAVAGIAGLLSGGEAFEYMKSVAEVYAVVGAAGIGLDEARFQRYNGTTAEFLKQNDSTCLQILETTAGHALSFVLNTVMYGLPALVVNKMNPSLGLKEIPMSLFIGTALSVGLSHILYTDFTAQRTKRKIHEYREQ